jgi:glycosyltransferase involved in cell wall biosynthesis
MCIRNGKIHYIVTSSEGPLNSAIDLIESEQNSRDMITLSSDSTPNPSERRLKVLFVPAWYPNKDHKFLGTFCREHAHAAALQEDVAVLALSSRPQRWPTMCWEETRDHNIPTFHATYGHSPFPKTTLPLFWLHLRRALKRVFREWGMPDIIHTQDTHAYHVMRAVEHLNIPVVMSQHWTGFMERSLDARTIRHFKYAFAHAVRVFPDNKYADIHYQHYGLPASVRWLPNTISTDIFYSKPNVSRKPWLLHASGMAYQKRFPDIVRAFARVHRNRPAAVLQVVGEGPDRQECETIARRELPPDSVRFHGYLTKPQLADLMRQASGFVLPSEAENLPCVLIEALACACPVLTTRVGGITALVDEKEGILVDVGNIDQIADGMYRLLDGMHGFDMKRISREVQAQYGHAAVGRLLHEEYRKVLVESFGSRSV